MPEWLLTGAAVVALASVIGVGIALRRNRPGVAGVLIALFVFALGVGLLNALMALD